MFVFRNIWSALFSCFLHFKICPFALLPTKIYNNKFVEIKKTGAFGNDLRNSIEKGQC